jgi:DNA-binding IclR family transcriptional regulator
MSSFITRSFSVFRNCPRLHKTEVAGNVPDLSISNRVRFIRRTKVVQHPVPKEHRMTPAALAASRAIAVIDFFTANPGRAFTLSEISAALDINLASLSSVLRSLTDSGYLVRHPRHKTYELGAALIAAGQAAAQQHPVVDLARPEMRKLAEATGTECVGSIVVGDEILILAIEGRPSPRTRGLALGMRLPLVPPFGQVFLAWSPRATIEHWITRGLGERARPPDRAHLIEALGHVHDRGYAINLAGRPLIRLNDTLAELARRPRDLDLRRLVAELVDSLGDDYELLEERPDESYDVEMISAPVFAADGSVRFAITLLGLSARSGRDLNRIGEEVATTGLTLTRQIEGRPGGPASRPRPTDAAITASPRAASPGVALSGTA